MLNTDIQEIMFTALLDFLEKRYRRDIKKVRFTRRVNLS